MVIKEPVGEGFCGGDTAKAKTQSALSPVYPSWYEPRGAASTWHTGRCWHKEKLVSLEKELVTEGVEGRGRHFKDD